MKTFYELIGEGEKDPAPWQIAIRAFCIFIIALILIRISGKRAFGMRSSFDNVISILLGAVLSRSLLGDHPFWSPVIAATTLTLLYLFCAWISTYSDTFGRLIKGDARVLYKDKKLFRQHMRSSYITDKDLEEEVRKEGNVDTLEKIKSAYLERDGGISIVKE